MQSLDTIHDYLARHSDEIGDRILSSYPALHGADETPSPLLSRMVRVPYPAQTLAIMGVSKRWQLASGTVCFRSLLCGSGDFFTEQQLREEAVKALQHDGEPLAHVLDSLRDPLAFLHSGQTGD